MNQWKVAPVTAKDGTEYYIQNTQTGRTALNLDGSETFRTRDGHLADIVCERMNEECNVERATD